MKESILTEEVFWDWHDDFKAAGGIIYRCFEIRGKGPLRIYQVIHS